MGKVAIAAIVGLSVVGVGGVGAYVSKTSDERGRARERTNKLLAEVSQLLAQLEAHSRCFDSLSDVTEIDEASGTINDDISSFAFDATTDGANNKSCVNVGWKKRYPEEGKWTGALEISWAMVNGDKAMTIFNTFTFPSGDAAKFKLEGRAQLMEKQENKWRVRHKKESSLKEVSVDDLDNYLPTTGSAIVGLKEDDKKSYWEFIGSKEELKTSVSGSTSFPLPFRDQFFLGSWMWTGPDTASEHGKLGDWSADLDWIEKIYPNWDIKAKIASFGGSWSLNGSITRGPDWSAFTKKNT